MRHQLASILTLLCTSLALSSVVGFVTLADEGPGQNVLITLTVSKTGGTGPREKIYRMMGQDRSDAKMMVASRTPIPTTSAASDNTGKAPAPDYTYQNEGIQARLSIRILDKGRISLNGEIELTGVGDSQFGKSDKGAPPVIVTFQQTLSAVVAEGKKLRVAEGPDSTGGILWLDIEATTLH